MSAKWLIGGAVVAALAVAGGFTFYNTSKKADYLTARLQRGDIDATISATGTANAVVTVQVGSQVSGNILALNADFNTKVTKGQLVARIDPAPFQAKVDQAKASLENAKASVINATASLAKAQSDIANAKANVANQQANLVRAQSAVKDAKVKLDRRVVMQKDGVIAKEDLDTAQATYDQAVASLNAATAQVSAAQDSVESAKAQHAVVETQLKSAQAQVQQQEATLKQVQLDLDHTQIISPVDGTVIARNMDVGQTVAASFSAPTIFQIAQDLTKMQVDANIDESDIGRVRLDQPVTFTVDAYPGQTFTGNVTQIRKAPTNVQNVITYDVVIKFDNTDLKLFPGMTTNVRILTDRQTAVIKLPTAALRFRPADALTAKSGNKGRGGRGGKGRGGQKGRGNNGDFQTIYLLAADGKATPQRVKLGISDGNFVAILSGNVQEGDQVITGLAPTNAKSSPGAPGQQNQFGRGRGGPRF